jgi:tetratricopeptide (TPR) repeat protein
LRAIPAASAERASGLAASEMMKCSSCGREIEAGPSFCPACGAPAVDSPAIAAMIQDARRALADDPGDAAARYNLAIAYKLGGLDDAAIDEFGRVVELQPDFGDAFYEMGLIHAKHARREKAMTALTRARELNPEDARAERLLRSLEPSD